VNCRRVRSQLSAYVDNELTGYEMFALREHLSHCRECRDEHYSLKTMKYLLSALPDKEPNPEWVALLAESISRPAPTITQRLFMYWERSVSAAVSVFVSREGQDGALVLNRRLASALTLSAVGVFLITASFDRPSARVATDPDARTPQSASIAPPVPFYGSDRPVGHPVDLNSGEMQFRVIPLPPPTLSGGTSSFLPTSNTMQPMPVSDQSSYLNRNGYLTNINTSINVHMIPPPGGMSSFGAPLPEPRFAGQSFGH